MAITLASDALSDAEITDGIGLGDLASAARLWVRHWQTALTAARLYVGRDEVPGLAAEALIATVSAIAIGRGPREDVSGFVTEAVRELGEDDEPPTPGPEHPPVFVSPMMTAAFAELDPELQDALRTAVAVGHLDEGGVRALTVLQHYYLAEHTDRAETPACRRAHIAMMSVADSSTTDGVPGGTWLHLSTCAWCTEAFHEVAFSNIALGALVEPSVLARVAALPVPEEPFVEPVYVLPEEPLLVDARPVPEEDDDEPAAALATHAGSRRSRLIAVGIAAAAAVSVVGVILFGQGSDTAAPTAADSRTTQTPAGDAADAPDTGTPSPSAFTTVAGPVLTAHATPTRTSARPKPAQTTTAAPTPKPSHSATPTASPTSAPSTPPTSPTPTPSPTSTPTRCNALQHLFGLC